MMRHDGEYGLGECDSTQFFFVEESYVASVGPFFLKDFIDFQKLAALLPPGALIRGIGNDDRQLESGCTRSWELQEDPPQVLGRC
jgi:hypothetical protein